MSTHGFLRGEKQMRMIYASDTGKTVKNIRTPIEDRLRFCLDDDQVRGSALGSHLLA